MVRRARRAARAEGQSSHGPWSSLPPELLGRVLALLEGHELTAAAAACRSWRGVAFAEPALWRSLRLDAQPDFWSGHRVRALYEADKAAWRPGKLRLVQRVGALVRTLAVRDASAPEDSWPLGRVFLAVPPGQLEGLSYSTATAFRRMADGRMLPVRYQHAAAMAELAAALPQARQLRRLDLTCESLPAAAADAVLQLTALATLRLNCSIPARLVSAVAQRLPGLESLSLVACLPADVRPLAALTQLTRLGLHDRSEDAGGVLDVPAPSSFPALQDFQYNCDCRRMEVAGLPDAQLARIEFAATADCDSGSICWDDAPFPRLYVFGAVGAPGPVQLAHALAPPGAPVQALMLRRCQLGGEQPGELGAAASQRHLAALRYLDVGDLTGPPGAEGESALQLVGSMVQQAQQLAHLSVSSMTAGGAPLPPSLVERRGLKRLQLEFMGLRDLPAGPYLQDLEELSLANNEFRSLPAALATATKLRRLELGVSLWGAPVGSLALSERGVRRTLAPLASLTHLCLAKQPRPAERALRALFALLPACRVRVLAQPGQAGGQFEVDEMGAPKHEWLGLPGAEEPVPTVVPGM